MAKSTGTQDYGIDVVLPGMLHATVRANPGRGGGMAGYDADAALAMQGVRSVVEVNEGLAVIADNTWFAFQAAEALEVEWLPPDYPASSAEMWQALDDAHPRSSATAACATTAMWRPRWRAPSDRGGIPLALSSPMPRWSR